MPILPNTDLLFFTDPTGTLASVGTTWLVTPSRVCAVRAADLSAFSFVAIAIIEDLATAIARPAVATCYPAIPTFEAVASRRTGILHGPTHVVVTALLALDAGTTGAAATIVATLLTLTVWNARHVDPSRCIDGINRRGIRPTGGGPLPARNDAHHQQHQAWIRVTHQNGYTSSPGSTSS